MKPRLQSSILLLITLAIGVLLGALLQSSIRYKRLKHMRFLRTDEMFVSQVEQAIQLQPGQQTAEVRAILLEAAPKITGTVQEHRDWLKTQFDALELRLRPLLDEHQQQRLRRQLHPPRPHREEEKK